MDHDECDPSELESFLQSCLLETANATLLDADDPLTGSGVGGGGGGGPLSAAPAASLANLLASSTPALSGRAACRPPVTPVPLVPLTSYTSSASAPAPLPSTVPRPPRVLANGLAVGSVPASVISQQPAAANNSKSPGPARHKPLNGVLMVPTPVQAAASPLQASAPARQPPGPQASPVPAASPFSAARSPGQSPAPAAAGSPVSVPAARVITSLSAVGAPAAAVVPALPHGVIISQSGALLSQPAAILSSQAGTMPTMVGDYRSAPQQQQQLQRMQAQLRQPVITGAFHQPGSGLITAGTIVSNGLQNLHLLGAPHNGGLVQLLQPGQTPLAAPGSRLSKPAIGKQPQLLPKTLAPGVPLAKQAMSAQPPMMLAPGGCGGGGPVLLTPVMIQQPGGGHQIQYILREQPNLLFSAAAGGAKSAATASAQPAVLLPGTAGGQAVLLQPPAGLLPPAGQLLQPAAIRLLAPSLSQLGSQLVAVAPHQPMLGGHQLLPPQLQLAAAQQPAPPPVAVSQPQSAAVQPPTRSRPITSGAGKKKKKDDSGVSHSGPQPAKKAFVDLEDIMKKSGIFGDLDDEPGLHTEQPEVKSEPASAEPAPAPRPSFLQPLQGQGEDGLQPASSRLVGPPTTGTAASSASVAATDADAPHPGDPAAHGAAKVVLNGALLPAAQMQASLLSGTLHQPVLSYAAGPGRPHLITVASQTVNGTTASVALSQAGLLQAGTRLTASAPVPMPVAVSVAATSSGVVASAGSVLSNLLSQPSKLPTRVSQSRSQALHSVSGETTLPTGTLHVPGGTLNMVVSATGQTLVNTVPAVTVAKSSVLLPVPVSVSVSGGLTAAVAVAGQQAGFQNAFLDNLIKNQLLARPPSKKKRREPPLRASTTRSLSVCVPTPASTSANGRRTISADSAPVFTSPASRVTVPATTCLASRLADSSISSTSPLDAQAPLRTSPASSTSSSSSLLPQSFSSGAESTPVRGVPSAGRAPVPGPPRSSLSSGVSAPSSAVPEAGSHKIGIQLSPENQQELNRVQLRMQLLLRADRTQRDSEELKRLETARQKILATGHQVRWPVPSSSSSAPAPSLLSPTSTASHCSSTAAPSLPPPLEPPQATQPHQLTVTSSQQQRGTKRPQETAPTHASITAADRERSDRFLQQLARDHRAALQPDTDTPFVDVADAVRRLSAYHVVQEPPACPDQLAFEEHCFQARAEYLHHKRQNMCNKYKRLLLKDSMRLHPSSESVQLLRYLNQHDRDQLDQERRAASASSAAATPTTRHGSDGCGGVVRSIKVRRDILDPSLAVSSATDGITPAPSVKTEPPSPAPMATPAAAASSAGGGGGDAPYRVDPTLRHLKLPPTSASAAAAAADADFDRLFDEPPLVNGHCHPHGDGSPRLEDDLNEQVQSAIKSILSIPREPELSGPGPGGGGVQVSPPVPSRFNINASFFNADVAGEDSEALDEAVRSILL